MEMALAISGEIASTLENLKPKSLLYRPVYRPVKVDQEKVPRWLERQKRMPRYVTATWLLVAVIVGNLISR